MAPELPRITEKEVRDRMVDLGKRIADLAENKGLPLPDLKEEFERDLGEGIALLQDITGMLEREESGPLEVAG
jgi:phosphoribosylaminoimidazole-succinocarboxamide synthase